MPKKNAEPLWLPLLVLTVLLTIQRCHDIDWTGWAALLALIPTARQSRC